MVDIRLGGRILCIDVDKRTLSERVADELAVVAQGSVVVVRYKLKVDVRSAAIK